MIVDAFVWQGNINIKHYTLTLFETGMFTWLAGVCDDDVIRVNVINTRRQRSAGMLELAKRLVLALCQ